MGTWRKKRCIQHDWCNLLTGKFADLKGTGTWSPITMHGDTTLGEWITGKCSASK